MELPVAPAGIFPASFGPGAAIGPQPAPTPILAPTIDAQTGERTSLFESEDPTFAAIVAALRTVRASGVAVGEIGQRLEDIRKNSSDAPELIRFELESVLAPFVRDGQIRVDAIEPIAGPDQGWFGRVTVRFTILKTSTEREVTT